MADERHPLARIAATPGIAKPDPILVAHHLRRSFGGIRAVDVSHLEIQRGTITSLIGPNGAGKTTLFNVLTGFDRPQDGEWHLDGGPLVGIPSFRIAQRGMVRTFQLTRSLARLTVLENVMVAAARARGETLHGALLGGWRGVETANEARARETLARFGLERMVAEYAGSLSGGQRKLLELARALMVEPALVMLDEPTAGVNPVLTQTLLAHITRLRDDGVTVVFIEHDMDVVFDVVERISVLHFGQVVEQGSAAEIRASPKVQEIYLGTG
ncbi:MAG TPA: ABC transporter ATP-binding protein [Actinobacteria bacterium]|nr:ABC transporter ATP-binding protein [Actinomycetota bacterium]